MVTLSIVSLVLSIWATAVIVRLEGPTTTQKVIYVALAWLLPIFGAVIAFIGSLRFRHTSASDTGQAMLASVAAEHQSRKTGSG